MIADNAGRIDYHEQGRGPTIVLLPGSCSTGAAWRPVVSALGPKFRCITTSLPGYGGTAERRRPADASIDRVAEAVENVILKAESPIHLVGHSFGGLAALAVALRRKVALRSLTMLEPPAVTVLKLDRNDEVHDRAFLQMHTAYRSAYAQGDTNAVSGMIDFYAKPGTFASWPPKVRAYAVETTHVNLVDWQSAYGFQIGSGLLATIDVPTLVVRGRDGHPAMQRITSRLAEHIRGAHLATMQAAAHFMIATHPTDVAEMIAGHVARAGCTDRNMHGATEASIAVR